MLLLIEDDEILGRTLLVELERGGFGARWRTTGAAGLEAIRTLRPHLVLLDLHLPDGSGLERLEQLRRSDDVPVIVLTARHDAADKVRALDLGADDYVTKPFWPDELLARIRAVLRRHRPRGASAEYRFHDVCVRVATREVVRGGEPVHLTPTELDVLLVLLRAPEGMAPHARLEQVLPHDLSSQAALQVHISRLRRKLGEAGARIRTVRGVGYRLEGRVDVA